ncbi:MAG: mechanosensitive ion channel family protein [Nitrospirae bacterium]|nr:mechanosensitive ion channel family protein [Nitrospirota bacterium]MBI3352457.1 mechanosensitive ion channel family protein [Nitrospirota bacterium]
MAFIERILKSEFIKPETFPGAIFYGFVFLILAWLGGRAIRFASGQLQKFYRGENDLVDRTTLAFITQLFRIGFYLVMATLYAHLIPELRSIGTVLLTGVSIVSVIVALAAQNTLGNLIAGVSLLLYRPFNVGDRLQVYTFNQTETGEVESVTLGYTVLKTFDNRRIVFPNSSMASQVTINLTTKDPRLITTIPFGIGYQSDIQKARQILLDLAKRHPLVLEAVDCPVTKLGDYSITVSLRIWCGNGLDAKKIEFDLYEQAKTLFDQEGIEIPFPSQNVILKRNNE